MICELFAFLPRIIIFLVGVFPFSHESAADHCSSIRFRVGEEAKKRQWSHCVSHTVLPLHNTSRRQVKIS
ncbi:hypothetical protein ACB092_08G090700 [Castanea dentata]